MALKSCKECGNKVSTKAASCPSCGAIIKKRMSGLGYFNLVALILMGLWVVSQPTNNYTETAQRSSALATGEKSTITKSTDRLLTNLQAQQSPNPDTSNAKMWASVDRLNRRTCPRIDCGIVGKLFFRESVRVFESKNGWFRITDYYSASCNNGKSDYVDSDNNSCVKANGIVNGEFAEWVKSDFLSTKQPPDPSVGSTGTAKLVAQSDDYRHFKTQFVAATEWLIKSGRCTAKDISDQGGWWKSTSKGQGIYFIYCGGGADRIYLDVSSGRIF